ncbi:MAG TPA: DUF3592 domain-containing protein [Acidimicrobiales bacterium]|nr:DUF3592 domain-containing protein [Acidimicrobiales bacterium]
MKWRRKQYPRPSEAQARVEARQLERVALIALLVALVPLAVFVWMWVPERRLANGPRAEAEVVRVESVRRTSKGPPQTSKLAVRFTTAGGQVVDATLRTTRTQFGDTVWLTYNPDSPEEVRAAEGPEQSWRVPLILGLTVVWFGSLQLWMAIRLRAGRPSRLWLKNRRPMADDLAPN